MLATLLAACQPMDGDDPFSWPAGGKAEDGEATALTSTALKLRPVPGSCQPELLILPRNARVTRRVATADPLQCMLSVKELGLWVPVRYRQPSTGKIFDGWVHTGYLKRCPFSWHSAPQGSGYFNITTYFIGKTEQDFYDAGQCSRKIKPKGLDRSYCYEFLCHFSGVAGQGTAQARDGRYISFARNAPGGRWPNTRYEKHLYYENCTNATFNVSDSVRGSSLRTLTADRSIAVHTCVIPLGAQVTLYFEDDDGSMVPQIYRADDTGGMIRGNDIDIFRGSYNLNKSFSASDIYVEWTQPE